MRLGTEFNDIGLSAPGDQEGLLHGNALSLKAGTDGGCTKSRWGNQATVVDEATNPRGAMASSKTVRRGTPKTLLNENRYVRREGTFVALAVQVQRPWRSREATDQRVEGAMRIREKKLETAGKLEKHGWTTTSSSAVAWMVAVKADGSSTWRRIRSRVPCDMPRRK